MWCNADQLLETNMHKSQRLAVHGQTKGLEKHFRKFVGVFGNAQVQEPGGALSMYQIAFVSIVVFGVLIDRSRSPDFSLSWSFSYHFLCFFIKVT